MDSWEGTKPLGKSRERTEREHESRGCSIIGWGAEQSLPRLVGSLANGEVHPDFCALGRRGCPESMGTWFVAQLCNFGS